MKLRLMIVALLAAVQLAAEETPAPRVPYPEGFREWTHLGSVTTERDGKTKDRLPHGIIHHLYANAKAMEGLRSGNYPEGAMFVADWFPLKVKYAGSFNEDARDRTDVMIKDVRFAAHRRVGLRPVPEGFEGNPHRRGQGAQPVFRVPHQGAETRLRVYDFASVTGRGRVRG